MWQSILYVRRTDLGQANTVRHLIDYEAICFAGDLGHVALCRKYCTLCCRRKAIKVLLSSVILVKLKDSKAPAERPAMENYVSQLLFFHRSTFGHHCNHCCFDFPAVAERWHVLVSLSKEDI